MNQPAFKTFFQKFGETPDLIQFQTLDSHSIFFGHSRPFHPNSPYRLLGFAEDRLIAGISYHSTRSRPTDRKLGRFAVRQFSLSWQSESLSELISQTSSMPPGHCEEEEATGAGDYLCRDGIC
jgi:hypothetical protein